MPNQYADAARNRKAFDLDAALTRAQAEAEGGVLDLTAGQVAALDGPFRLALAKIAGTTPPSDATWARLVELRRLRERNAHLDPFEGLS